MEEGFNINNIDIANEDVVVTFTPSSRVRNYSYRIIKNNSYGEIVNIDNNEKIDIKLSDTGTYKIEITTYNYYGVSDVILSGNYVIDKDAPVLNINTKTFKIKKGNSLSFMDGVSASDAVDGDLTNLITTNIDEIDLNSTGVKTLKYSVSDKAGNVTTSVAYITVKPDNTNLIRIGQISISFITILLIILLFKYIRSIMLERRFSKYTINSIKNKSISLLDNLYIQYKKFIEHFSKMLSKSSFLLKRASRYSKYNDAFDLKDDDNMKFMANKIVLGIVYLIIVASLRLLQSEVIGILEILIAFIIGFYVLDIIYIYKYSNYRKKIENDLLQAIIVMNNSFKAGNSITQSIEMVSLELDGPIAKEFKKISLELSLGLDLELAFKRFSDRVKIEEAVYLTSSLSTLNKTGGNIIKVFSTIEKTLYNRKKLKVELKALTGSSRLIMYVLAILPPGFVVLINTINNEYFLPLFNNPLGITLIGIILLFYIMYIFTVRKIMKIRM